MNFSEKPNFLKKKKKNPQNWNSAKVNVTSPWLQATVDVMVTMKWQGQSVWGMCNQEDTTWTHAGLPGKDRDKLLHDSLASVSSAIGHRL
jgi:hypothetical protein